LRIPIGDAGGDTDWYGYCVDDPVNRVDVWGLKTFNVGVSGSATGSGGGGTVSTSMGRDGEGKWSWLNRSDEAAAALAEAEDIERRLKEAQGA